MLEVADGGDVDGDVHGAVDVETWDVTCVCSSCAWGSAVGVPVPVRARAPSCRSDPVGYAGDTTPNTRFGAACESGLDNSPMYDVGEGEFDAQGSHHLRMADVGQTALVMAEAEALIELARVGAVDRQQEAAELRRRVTAMQKAMGLFWDSEEVYHEAACVGIVTLSPMQGGQGLAGGAGSIELPKNWGVGSEVMTFQSHLDALIPKISFSFFAEFRARAASGARVSVSVGFWGARQLSLFFGGGLARGLHQHPPPHFKAPPPKRVLMLLHEAVPNKETCHMMIDACQATSETCGPQMSHLLLPTRCMQGTCALQGSCVLPSPRRW